MRLSEERVKERDGGRPQTIAIAENGPASMTSSPAPKHAAWLYWLAALISIIGLSDAIYLTVEHLAGRNVRCTVTSGCDEVLASPYAALGGIPLAALGALAYFTVFSLATLAAFGYRQAGSTLRLVVALMLAMTLWLLYVQAFVLHAFCQYCLLSAAATLSLTAILIIEWAISRRQIN